MIKGVSRRIIEVNNADSPYFDKAVFYLRPGVNILPEEIGCREIDRYLRKNNIVRKNKKSSVFDYFVSPCVRLFGRFCRSLR